MLDILRAPRHRATALALFCAIVGGAAFRLVDAPLPWLIGPMLSCAVVNMATGKLLSPRAFQYSGQWVIGVALGLYFTPQVTGHLLRIGGWILLGVLWAVALGIALAGLMRRICATDWPTAFFATAIGGASEMLVQAERVGGHGASVAAAHSVRLMLVVVTIPFVYRALDLHGTDPYQPAGVAVHAAGLAGLLAITALAAVAVGRLGWPNSWVIGPLVVAAGITAAGYQPSAVPAWLAAAGQVAIGMTLGTRFTPAFVGGALRMVLVSIAITVISVAACAVFAWLLGRASGIPVATLVLATSPGGVAEMSLTARNLELGVPVVTAFHVTRMAVVVLSIGPVFRLTTRAADRLRRPAGRRR